jgi:L-cysteine:1D-myo-inositol 2-amino-2-deoxy-alpha-D-glucopyranoside ligase
MQLYNSLSQKVERFVPRGDEITIYVCGITPYDTTHLGHMATYAAFDTLIRYLESGGSRVRYVQNVTDIDDDILRKAREVGGDWREVGNRWTAHFIRDMQALNVRPPDFYPGATDVIPGIVAMVERLLQAGVAYEANGNVYFQAARWPDFGKLSRMSYDEMLPIANERGNRPDDPNKRDPLDFVLWQAQAPGEPAWESPWGLGRPGWHIECSTMSTSLLGPVIDIHGGGADLLFPHHECEIAQSECATGEKPFVRFWLHTAMVRHEGEKMSKSLGNLIMIRDLLEQGWSADALRLYLARHHYREAWSHDEQKLAQAEEFARLLRLAVVTPGGHGPQLGVGLLAQEFAEAMENDLDTPRALAVLKQLAQEIVVSIDTGQDVSRAQALLRQLAAVVGLRLDAPAVEERVERGWGQHLARFTG